MFYRLAVLACFQVVLGVGPSIAAVDTKAAESREDEAVVRKFESEKKFMTDDLAGKIAVMKEAKECAESASNAAALEECNVALREKILKRASER